VIFRDVVGEQQLVLFHLGQAGTAPSGGSDDMPDVAPAAPAPGFGDRLRSRREASGMSLRELARSAGLSASFLSQIERSQAEPSVQSLRRLSEALDVDITTLLGAPDVDLPRHITRASERTRLSLIGAGYTVHPFGTLKNGSLEASVVEIESGGEIGDPERAWSGEQFVYVIAGRLHLRDGRQVTELGPDDGGFVFGERPLRLGCSGATPVRLLLVQTTEPR